MDKTVIRKRQLLKFFLGMLVAFCGLPAIASDNFQTVNIGFVGPITGMSQSAGKGMLNAAQLAIDDLNKAALGINDKKVHFQLLAQDDESNPNIGKIAAQYLVHSKVAGVVGFYNSSVALNSSAIYQQAGIAHLSLVASYAFTHQGFDTAFRMVACDNRRADILVRFAVNEMGKNKLAIVYTNDFFGDGFKESFIKSIGQLDAKVVSINSFNPNSYDFNQVNEKLKSTRPDAVLFAGVGDQTAMFAKYIHGLNSDIPIFTATAIVDSQYKLIAGEKAKATFSLVPGVHSQKSEALLNFEKAYRQRFGDHIEIYAATAYDQVQVLAAAVMKAGTAEPHAVTNALHAINYKGLTGKISFNVDGDLRELSYSMYQFKDASWDLVKEYKASSGC